VAAAVFPSIITILPAMFLSLLKLFLPLRGLLLHRMRTFAEKDAWVSLSQSHTVSLVQEIVKQNPKKVQGVAPPPPFPTL
jgi:hypothetical protein